MFKSVIASALVAASIGLGLGTAPADAKTRVHIGVGIGSPYLYDDCLYYDCGYYPRVYHRPFYRDPYFGPRFYYPRYRYRAEPRGSCDAAARAIRNAGYRNVVATDCKGRYYGFKATRKGKRYSLKVDNATGRISRQ